MVSCPSCACAPSAGAPLISLPAGPALPLQEELTKRGLDTKWNPLKGKKELVERLQVRLAGGL